MMQQRTAGIGARPSPPDVLATVSYLISLRTLLAGDAAGSRCPEAGTERLEPGYVQVGVTRGAGARYPPRRLIYGRFNRTSSSGADHGNGSIFISEASSTRGPIPLGQKKS
jgi:hypothetical protein